MPVETRAVAFSAAQATAIFGAHLDAAGLLDAGGYRLAEGQWWTRSPRQIFDPENFFQPSAVSDPFGNATTIEYDVDGLLAFNIYGDTHRLRRGGGQRRGDIGNPANQPEVQHQHPAITSHHDVIGFEISVDEPPRHAPPRARAPPPA